jgi:uncharacterized protein YbaR (Trm112 family)
MEGMKKEIVDILCCPTCKADLLLHIDEENENEVVKGTLTCTVCHVNYPIENGIPNLLPKEE